MIERKPLLGFLWPATPPGPVDHGAVQEKWLRIPPRGPWRLAFLIVASMAWVSLLPSALISLVVAPSILACVLVVTVLLPTGALLVRGWAAGTYVSDRGLKVSRVLSTTFIPWADVIAVRADETRCGLLGTPVRARAQSVSIDTPEGTEATTVTTVGPDLWLRPQAWHASKDRFDVWWRETRVNQRPS